MRTTILLALILLFLNGFSQSNSKKTIFTEVLPGETKTIIINVKKYDNNVVGKFKDDLKQYNGKIFNVLLNENTSELRFTYNEFMSKEDLVTLFDKHKISYFLLKIDNAQLPNQE